jgi:hypothetical protein
MQNCNICTEKFNKSTRNKIKCEYCDFEACNTCCRKWILSESAPRCMNNSCSRTWTRKFISANFPKSFVNHELKQHREDVLLQQEIALLPETQPYVEEIIRKENINHQIYELRKQQMELEHRITQLRNNLYTNKIIERKEFLRECPDEGCRGFLSTVWKCGLCEKWTCPDCHEVKGLNRDIEHVCDPNAVATAQLIKKETKPCPKCRTNIFKIDGCFAKNTQILCWDRTVKMSEDILVGDVLIGDDGQPRTVLNVVSGVDELYEIHQEKGVNYVVNSKHTLVLLKNYQIVEMRLEDYMKLSFYEKEELMGVKFLNGKCLKTSIHIESIGKGNYYGWEVDANHRFLLSDYTIVRNCDQMWCTQCHTGFNWRTGRIETHVHNPHFFEWQRMQETNTENGVPRNNHIRNPCENAQVVTNETSRNIFNIINNIGDVSRETKMIYRDKLSNIIRNIIHIQVIEMYRYNINYAENNRDLRIQYMRNKISENEFKIIIQRNSKKYDKNTEMRNVLELLINTVSDIIFRIHNNLTNSRILTRLQMDNLRFESCFDPLLEIDPIINYVNDCFREISKTYSSKLVQYDNEMRQVRV